ncbi:MAG: hypothetical protein ACOC3V_00750 [bacterium]
MKKKPTVLIVYKRNILYLWTEVDRYYYFSGDDIMDIFRKYRDVYKNKFGENRLKLVHKWSDDVYEKW